MSHYDRRTGVKQLRVRGLGAVRFRATLKALALNIMRAVAVMVALGHSPSTLLKAFGSTRGPRYRPEALACRCAKYHKAPYT